MEQMSFLEDFGPSFQTNKKAADGRKLRGGYYTPADLARFLVDWGLDDHTKHILEPSCGDGNFVLALLHHLEHAPRLSASITAIELMPTELASARARAERFGQNGTKIEWHNQDFFAAYGWLKQQRQYDLIVGNPPFIRFQNFDDHSRALAFSHLRQAGYKPTKLANAWSAFVQLSIELLRDGGRLAVVVPAELLQVKYAGELRDRLATQFQHIVIVGFRQLVFPEIQQEVVLLLADGKRESSPDACDIHTIEFQDGRELVALNNLDDAVAHTPAKHSRPGMKWTSLFLDDASYAALDRVTTIPTLTSLGRWTEVDVGIVTGRNAFFVVSSQQRMDLQATPFTIPIVGRTSALKTTRFGQAEFTDYSTRYPSYLLNLNGVSNDLLPPQIQDYIKAGEREGVHLGYKCRVRKRWFDVPSIYIPDAFLFRQIHRYPLMVANEAQATSTDTIHRVRLKPGVDTRLLATTLFNSLTLAWAEVCGRSYGGGVLELEPAEAEELLVCYEPNLQLDIEKVENLLRLDRPYEALDYVDKVVLQDFCGMDQSTVTQLRRAWAALRDRRIHRK